MSPSRESSAERLREQIYIYEAVHRAMERWPEVSDLAYRSTSHDELMAQLGILLDIDEAQSSVVLDQQVRRVTSSERQRTADQLAGLRRDLSDLTET